ncbi:unnamed protein product [Linum tenue]|uniref:Uncharacterized protein n=1 Tax=Linum tenue TaxID=586396 RepID=A0AAV0Q4X9_9ROSI|nr:unnamed protein product [Linum tenue]
MPWIHMCSPPDFGLFVFPRSHPHPAPTLKRKEEEKNKGEEEGEEERGEEGQGRKIVDQLGSWARVVHELIG